MKKLLISLTFLAATAHAQYCVGYDKEYSITLSGNMGVSQSNFTLLVSGTYPYLAGTGSGGFSRSPNGYDITFNQLGTTPLVWNMPLYVTTTGQIKANVLIPSAASGTVISMCVGKAGMVAPTGNAYDSFTNVALEFGSAGFATDSTTRHTGTNSGAVYSSNGPTYLHDAAVFSGGSALNFTDTGLPINNDPRSFSWWANPTDTPGYPNIFLYGGGAGNSHNLFQIGFTGGKTFTYDGAGITAQSGISWPMNSWHRYDVVYLLPGTPATRFYFDGVLEAYPQVYTGVQTILGGNLGIGGAGYSGSLAGLKQSSGARTGAWIAAEFSNQSNPPAFYSVAYIPPPARPILSGVTITANSPLSVKATWTTDLASNSQILCGLVSGGPYTHVSNIVNPNFNGWNVTAHSMVSNPMPNAGAKYCVALSAATDLFSTQSAETGPITLPAPPASVPIAMVNPSVMHSSQLSDRKNGIHGAPTTGEFDISDNNYFCWADDNNEYLFTTGYMGQGGWGGGPPATLSLEFMKFTDQLHINGARIGTAWQNGWNNSGYNTWHTGWLSTSCISVNGSMYVGPYNFDGMNGGFYSQMGIIRTTDHFQTTIAPLHNLGPDTTYITAATCSAGVATVTSKLNITDQLPIIVAPRSAAMLISGATPASINGLFGPVTSATATTISWAQNCATWGIWSPTGGTGSGGGVIGTYGWDIPTQPTDAMYGAWVQNDGPDYVNGTKAAGMDSMVYWLSASSPIILSRMPIALMPLQATLGNTIQHYIGKQLGDDGLYDSAWESSYGPNATQIDPVEFATRANGKGSVFPQMQYLTALNRFVVAQEVGGVTDSNSGGTAIYDAGPYPWSPLTLIGSARRDADNYWEGASGPEFPQFVAKSQTASNGVTTINLAHSGQNFGGYDLFMTQGLQFTVKPTTPVLKSALTPDEISNGLDLAYNFDVPTGSITMPNAAPSDPAQKWAWAAPELSPLNPIYTDKYGSILHSLPSTSASGGFYPSAAILSMAFPTPYAAPLPGPLTIMNCFGHFPGQLLLNAGSSSIAMVKGTDLIITGMPGATAIATMAGDKVASATVTSSLSGYAYPPPMYFKGAMGGAVGHTVLTGTTVTGIVIDDPGKGYVSTPTVLIAAPNSDAWDVSFLGTPLGRVAIPDGTIGCLVVRRDSSNRVTLYNSAGIGKSLPITSAVTPVTVSGAWSTSPLVIGDGGPAWGGIPRAATAFYGNSFWGVESLLRIWSRDLADDELIAEMAAVRTLLWARGKGSSIP